MYRGKRPKKEGSPRALLGGRHVDRRRSQRPDGVVQQGTDDGGRGAGHGHLQLHEGQRRRRGRQRRREPLDRHADGGERDADAASAVRRGCGRHNGLSGRCGEVSRVPEDGGDRVARLQGTSDVGRILVVFPVPAIPEPVNRSRSGSFAAITQLRYVPRSFLTTACVHVMHFLRLCKRGPECTVNVFSRKSEIFLSNSVSRTTIFTFLTSLLHLPTGHLTHLWCVSYFVLRKTHRLFSREHQLVLSDLIAP